MHIKCSLVPKLKNQQPIPRPDPDTKCWVISCLANNSSPKHKLSHQLCLGSFLSLSEGTDVYITRNKKCTPALQRQAVGCQTLYTCMWLIRTPILSLPSRFVFLYLYQYIKHIQLLFSWFQPTQLTAHCMYSLNKSHNIAIPFV